jgi:multidrug efflux pump subunit AcrA (membrane-fusion protein)
MTALRPKVGSEDSSLFVFDAESQTLTERTVTVANVENNSLVVVGDLKAGETIATAGVSFLHEGMQVTLLDANLLK